MLLTVLGWGAFHFTQGKGDVAIPSAAALLVIAVLGAAGVINIPYLLLPRSAWRDPRLHHLQILLDIAAISVLVYLTGGARSLFVPFYFAAILAACFSLSERAAVGYAALAAILLSGLTVLYAAAPADALPLLEPAFVQARSGAAWGHLLLQGVSTFIVAFLGGRLAAGLRRAEHLNEVILENLSDGVISVDAAGFVTYANPEALRILGADPGAAAPGSDVRSLLSEGAAGDLERVLAGGGSRFREVPAGGIPESGGRRACEIRISSLYGPRGAITGAILVLTDVTVRKRLEKAELAAERLQSTAQMAAGIAHEVRNPLASIRACAQELARSLKPEGPDDARLLDVMVRESDHVNRIVSGVIDFARPVRLHERPFEMEPLVADTVEMSRLRFAQTGSPFRIETMIPPGMSCRGDPDLLRQAFMNLTHNAFQAMEFGGGNLAIRAAAERGPGGDPGVSISFADTGSGIRPEDANSIFTPFFTTKPGGTGLGLAVTQKIIQAHGGEIRLESAPGKGTCVTVWLPQRKEGA